MVETGVPTHNPIPIGEIAKPPFRAVAGSFGDFRRPRRAARALTGGEPMSPYLLFLASLCEAQHRIQDGLPARVPASA